MEKQTLLDRLESFNEQLNLTHYWISFLKYKSVIIILPMFIGLLGYLVALNIKPIFQSNATLLIEADKKLVDIEEVYNKGVGITHIKNQIQILKSDEMLNTVFNDKETLQKVRDIYNRLPEKFLSRNIKAIKKLILFKQDNKKN